MMEFRLPSLGSDMDQGKLLEWKVKPGERVQRGQVVAVVDTSKAAIDVEIWQPGIVQQLLTQPGETIPVGTVMATLLAEGEGQTAADETANDTAAIAQAAAAPAVPRAPVPQPPLPGVAGERHPSSPAARRHARELGIDIDRVAGSGPHGVVTLQDVDAAAHRPAAAQPAPDPALANAAAERSAGMRKAIAAAMARSKRDIPHYYLAETICMRKAVDCLGALNAGRPVTERVLMGALQLKAVALALRRFPELNGFYRNEAFQPGRSIHVGVAVSLRQGGLVAPALHDVDQLPLPELMRALADLVTRARAGSLRSSEMSDATITVTNLGDQGVEVVHGVIYPPQVALVGFGRVAMRPWAENDVVTAQPVVTASLAADHRVSDGHRGARFLSALNEQLQYPEDL